MEASRLSLSNEKSQQIQQVIRSKINHSYNQQVFNKQLNQEIQNNLVKMEEGIIKDLKRKLYLEQQEKLEDDKREKMKRHIEQKLQHSKQRRERKKKEKSEAKMGEKQYKHDLFVERISDVRRRSMEENSKKYEAVSQKLNDSAIKYNKINQAVSLIEEPYYQKNQRMTEEDIMKLKQIVDSRKNPNTKLLRQESLMSQNQFMNQTKSKEFKTDLNSEEMEMLANKKKQYLLSQLKGNISRSTTSLPSLGPRSLSLSSVRTNKGNSLVLMHESKKPMVNSILYEQSEEREKHSYRKSIKDEIKEYMVQQKQKLLLK